MTRVPGGRAGGLPVRTFEEVPGVPPVCVMRFPRREPHRDGPSGQAHTHDFLALTYFERGGGSLRLGERDWSVEAGDAYVVAPGEVIGGGEGASGFREVEGWAVSFPPEALGLEAPGVFLSWRAHPLLFPFVEGAAGGAQRLKVPLEERESWSDAPTAPPRSAGVEQAARKPEVPGFAPAAGFGELSKPVAAGRSPCLFRTRHEHHLAARLARGE